MSSSARPDYGAKDVQCFSSFRRDDLYMKVKTNQQPDARNSALSIHSHRQSNPDEHVDLTRKGRQARRPTNVLLAGEASDPPQAVDTVLPKVWPPWQISRSKSFSRLKSKRHVQERASQDFSNVFQHPLESPLGLEHSMVLPATVSPSPTSSHFCPKISRKPVLRTSKSSHALRGHTSTAAAQSFSIPRGPPVPQSPQYPPRSSSFDNSNCALAFSSTIRPTSQTLSQRRGQTSAHGPMTLSRVSTERTRPSLDSIPSLSFSSDRTISVSSSVQTSPMEARYPESWPEIATDGGQLSSTPSSPSAEFSQVIRQQNLKRSLVNISIYLDEAGHPPASTTAREAVCSAHDRALPTATERAMISQPSPEVRAMRVRHESITRPMAPPPNKPLPCIPKKRGHEKGPHSPPATPVTYKTTAVFRPTLRLMPSVPSVPSSDDKRRVKSQHNADPENMPTAHKHSASSPDTFGSHFEWDDKTASAARKTSERKANFGQSCKQFLHKLSSSGVNSRQS